MLIAGRAPISLWRVGPFYFWERKRRITQRRGGAQSFAEHEPGEENSRRGNLVFHRLYGEIDADANGVGDAVEGHVVGHAEIAAVEREVTVDLTATLAFWIESDLDGDGLGDAVESEVALELEFCGIGGGNGFSGCEGDGGKLLHIEKFLALDDVVFGVAAGGHTGRGNLQVELPVVEGAGGGELQFTLPGLEDAVDVGEGGADEELDAAFRDVNGEFESGLGLRRGVERKRRNKRQR